MKTGTSIALLLVLSAANAAAQKPAPKAIPHAKAPAAPTPPLIGPAMTSPMAYAPPAGRPRPVPLPPPTMEYVPMPAPVPDPLPAFPRFFSEPLVLPPEAAGQDPADVLWNQARAEMNRQNYGRAADLFQRLIDRYGKSQHAPNAYYWAAFSLYKRNSTSDLREAKRLLEEQLREHPRASTRTEGEALLVRISGELASRGDAESARVVAEKAAHAAAQPCPESEDEEVRAAALNALMRMGSENAMPLLRQIMQRRDACSAELRRTAVYMVTRQDSPEREAILLEAVRSDPDPEVRKAAVFWMSRSQSEKAVDAIQEIMRTTSDPEIQQAAVHALSQHPSPRAAQALREIAASRNTNAQVRQAAVHWIGQNRDPANGPFLRDLFGRMDNVQVKESILHILSRHNDQGNAEWLLSVAQDRQQPEQIRKAALFWASQGRTIPTSQFAKLYDAATDVDMKQQILYSLSRRNDAAALDKMVEIAKHDSSPELRKTAIFWLSQSKDPRAIKALQEIAGG